jgi:5-(carboxyamino)imidazole ribonucleotide mutase
VATVGIGAAGATNAAILAAQILATADVAIAERVAVFRAEQSKKVRIKDAALGAKWPPGA